MVEILILYIISQREKTIYSIRKEIIERFGIFTTPSLGTIHPALKRLLAKKAVTSVERLSDGGKKSSYYSITPTGKNLFHELFMVIDTHNPWLFYSQLQTRLATLSMLSKTERIEFIDLMIARIEGYYYEKRNTLDDEFIAYDYYQIELVKKTLEIADSMMAYLKKLRAENAC